jgi:mannosyl-3-phosphoglycerate phosphatase family protein
MESRKRTAVRLRPKGRAHSGAVDAAHRVAIFTAVDATLLDAKTFDPGPARSTVARLHAAGVPVVPVSVMTFDEIAPLAEDLGLGPSMIIEAGGAIARRIGDHWVVEPCGPPAEALLDVVREIEDRSGADLLVYSALPEADAARYSGRAGEMLRASTRRHFSEPIIIESGKFGAVSEAAGELGFTIRRGRRFFHLCRECDEGEAFTRVRDELGCEVTIAVGGSPLDAEFLTRADVAIIVPGPDGIIDPDLRKRVPEARMAPGPAPNGWAVAVEDALQSASVMKRRARRA